MLYIKMCSKYFSPFALTGESLGWASECFSVDFSVCVHLYSTSAPLLCATLSPMYICFPTFYLHAWLPSLGDSTLTELSSQKRLSWLQYVLLCPWEQLTFVCFCFLDHLSFIWKNNDCQFYVLASTLLLYIFSSLLYILNMSPLPSSWISLLWYLNELTSTDTWVF